MTASDKTALLTGASSGIGQWTALGFVKAGYRVIAPVRDPKRGSNLLAWLRTETMTLLKRYLATEKVS